MMKEFFFPPLHQFIVGALKSWACVPCPRSKLHEIMYSLFHLKHWVLAMHLSEFKSGHFYLTVHLSSAKLLILVTSSCLALSVGQWHSLWDTKKNNYKRQMAKKMHYIISKKLCSKFIYLCNGFIIITVFFIHYPYNTHIYFFKF